MYIVMCKQLCWLTGQPFALVKGDANEVFKEDLFKVCVGGGLEGAPGELRDLE